MSATGGFWKCSDGAYSKSEKNQVAEKKSVKMTLIGYDDNVKGYRLYNQQTNTITTSRCNVESYTKTGLPSMTVIALYVDDSFIFSNDEQETERLKKALQSKFKLKDLGVTK